MQKQAICLLTYRYNSYLKEYLQKMVSDLRDLSGVYDVILLYDRKSFNELKEELVEGVKLFEFSSDNFEKDGYLCCGDRFSRCRFKNFEGCTQWALCELFKKEKKYDYAWLIEDDVFFNGDWHVFFDFFKDKKEDFITSHIEDYRQFHRKWWLEFAIHINNAVLNINEKDFKKSFNVIFRLSRKAAECLDAAQQNGNFGFNEIFMPTVLHYCGFSMKDLGGKGNYVYKDNLFYVGDSQDGEQSTVRWQEFKRKELMNIPNMLYHSWKKGLGTSRDRRTRTVRRFVQWNTNEELKDPFVVKPRNRKSVQVL